MKQENQKENNVLAAEGVGGTGVPAGAPLTYVEQGEVMRGVILLSQEFGSLLMNLSLRLIPCCLLILASTSVIAAKPWRGIVPLRSTRADVERILGKPSRLDYIYDFEKFTVRVMYAQKRCELGIPSGWGNWNVAKDTVINVWVETDFPLRKLKIRNLERYKWYTDDSLATYYRLPAQGLEYTVQEGRVHSITYGPTKKDEVLLCQKNVPEIRY